MNSKAGLIARLDRTSGLDRRLDAEVVAAVLGPEGCTLDSNEGLDGWDIEFAPDRNGEAGVWREAADIPGVTAFLDAACELVTEARPTDAAALMARALRHLGEPAPGASGADYGSRAARAIVAELLRSAASVRSVEPQAA